MPWEQRPRPMHGANDRGRWSPWICGDVRVRLGEHPEPEPTGLRDAREHHPRLGRRNEFAICARQRHPVAANSHDAAALDGSPDVMAGMSGCLKCRRSSDAALAPQRMFEFLHAASISRAQPSAAIRPLFVEHWPPATAVGEESRAWTVRRSLGDLHSIGTNPRVSIRSNEDLRPCGALARETARMPPAPEVGGRPHPTRPTRARTAAAGRCQSRGRAATGTRSSCGRPASERRARAGSRGCRDGGSRR